MKCNQKMILKDFLNIKTKIENKDYESQEEKETLLMDCSSYINYLINVNHKFAEYFLPWNNEHKSELNEIIYRHYLENSMLNNGVQTIYHEDNQRLINNIGTIVLNNDVLKSNVNPFILKNKEKYVDKVKYFAQYFNADYYKIFDKLSKKNIELSNEKLQNSATGFCTYIDSLDQSLIYSVYKNNSSITTLPHEVMHAYDINNIDNKSNYRYSIFRECMPKFIELLFCDYLKEIGYEKLGISKKSIILNTLSINSCFVFDALKELQNNKNTTNAELIYSYKKIIDYFLSNVYAINFYYLFNEDFDKYLDYSEKFYANLGKDDNAIINLFNQDDIINSFLETVNKNNYEVSKVRKF